MWASTSKIFPHYACWPWSNITRGSSNSNCCNPPELKIILFAWKTATATERLNCSPFQFLGTNLQLLCISTAPSYPSPNTTRTLPLDSWSYLHILFKGRLLSPKRLYLILYGLHWLQHLLQFCDLRLEITITKKI